MTLADWNKLVEYGNKLCDDLNQNGCNVRLKPYSAYDGRRGLAFQMLDGFGCVHKEYLSGLDTPHIMKITMEANARRIIRECK